MSERISIGKASYYLRKIGGHPYEYDDAARVFRHSDTLSIEEATQAICDGLGREVVIDE